MSNTADTPQSWPGDLTLICERLATQLASEGARHPVAAAVMLAARGHTALTQAEFATRYQLDLPALQATEAGHVPWADLPHIAGALLDTFTNVDLLALADLDATQTPNQPRAAEN